MIVLAFLAFMIMRLFRGNGLPHILVRSFGVIMVVNLFLNMLFYPVLFKYQSGNAAAAWINGGELSMPAYLFNDVSPEYAFQFYCNEPTYKIDTRDLDTMKNQILVYTSQAKADSLQHMGYRLQVIQRFQHFHISQLTGKFINQKTREEAIDYFVIAMVQPGLLAMQPAPDPFTNTTAPFFASDVAGGLHRPRYTTNAGFFYQ
jgi:hypothetical protein